MSTTQIVCRMVALVVQGVVVAFALWGLILLAVVCLG